MLSPGRAVLVSALSGGLAGTSYRQEHHCSWAWGGVHARTLAPRARPLFVVGINNLSRGPIDFRVAQVEANQRVGASKYPMQVVTFEMLQQEEKNRQVASAILVGVAGAANAYSASHAGYGSYTTPSGRTGTFYSPTAA